MLRLIERRGLTVAVFLLVLLFTFWARPVHAAMSQQCHMANNYIIGLYAAASIMAVFGPAGAAVGASVAVSAALVQIALSYGMCGG
jgi:hypothetical protein